MFVLGIDPGLSRCGYGIIETTRRGVRAVTAGVMRTDPAASVPARLAEIHNDVTELIGEYGPQAMAIEQVFTNRNLQTAISVGRASGVALLAAAEAGLVVHEYSPSAVKLAVTGYGQATKDQIRYMVAARLGLPAAPEPADAADALAIALCFVQEASFRLRVGSR